jgi:hypothetical protein
MQIYAIENGLFSLIDPSAQETALEDVLEAMWELPARLDNGFALIDGSNRFAAAITVIQVLGDRDGIVEVYEVGLLPRRLRIRYISVLGEYARTEILTLTS